MERHPHSKLFANLQQVTQHNIILLRRIKDLLKETSEERLLEENIIPEKLRKEEVNIRNADKYKTPELHSYEAPSKSYASDWVAEESRKTREYASFITGIVKNQQQSMNKWHMDDFNAKSQRRKHPTKDLSLRFAILTEKKQTEINLMRIKVDNLGMETEKLRKHLEISLHFDDDGHKE
ncbi:unnamed protein product [Orchesella dallaii]|uniref:Uncharacterized protein n=1 Tax=Orchesella dallaii TaxID=48710 RepID=A0ABP1RHV4_9HEXA